MLDRLIVALCTVFGLPCIAFDIAKCFWEGCPK